MKTLYFLFFLLTCSTLSFAQGFLGLDRVICTGGSTTLDAGSGYDEYHWSNSSTSQSILVTSAGNYAAERIKITGSPLTDISQSTSSGYQDYSAEMGQSFTPNHTGYLRTINLVQGPFQDATSSVNLYVTKGAGPDVGTIISTTSFALPATGSGQTAALVVNIPGNILVYKDTVYTFYFSNGGTVNISMASGGSDVYAGGSFYVNSSTENDDLAFNTIVEPATVESDTVNVTESGPCTAITDAAHHAEVTIYPNPVKDNRLHLEGIFDRIELSDLQGNVVAILTPIDGDVVLPSLNKGLYLVKAETTDGKILTNKLSVE